MFDREKNSGFFNDINAFRHNMPLPPIFLNELGSFNPKAVNNDVILLNMYYCAYKE